MGPNSQAMTGPSGGPAGLTAAQVTTAIVKGTEGPLQALAQANEQTWLLIGKSPLPSAPLERFLIFTYWSSQVPCRNNSRTPRVPWSPMRTLSDTTP